MLPSFNQDCQIRNYDCKADVEFNFWGASNTQYYQSLKQEELQGNLKEEFDDYSVRIWKRRTSRKNENETSSLLPHPHNYNSTSRRSGSQVIADARKELMERIRDMPESSYELSLKDIVDEQLVPQGENEENATQRADFHLNTSGTQIKIKKKQTRFFNKPGQISRSSSLEKESFMIKMFIPSSISWKNKVKGGTSPKVSPRIIHQQDIELCQSLIPSKLVESYSSLFLGCYPFFRNKKNKNNAER